MKLKVSQILNINEYLKKIIDTEKNVDVLFKFKLLGIMKEFEPTVTNFDFIRNEKIAEYGTKSDDGMVSIEPNTDAHKKFMDELNVILDSEIDVNITKIKATEALEKNVESNYLIGLYDIMEGK